MRKDRYGENVGAVSVAPKRQSIEVGRRYWLEVTYTAGPSGVKTGGALRFKLPGLILKNDSRGPVSCSNPDVEWEASNHLPMVDGKPCFEFNSINYLFVSIRKGELFEGDSITVRYGASSVSGVSAATWACEWPVEVAGDIDGRRSAPWSGFQLVPNPPLLTFVHGRPFRMEVFVPSYVGVDEPFRVVSRVMDRYGNLVEDFTGTVALQARCGDDQIDLGERSFEPRHRGVMTVEFPGFNEPGVYRVSVGNEALGIQVRSNPMKVSTNVDVRLYWGDTHCHSRFSADSSAINERIRRPAEDYAYARDRAALDFCMVTDHVEDQSEADWEESRRAAREADEPGRFVAFSSFEATFYPLRQDGDKNVYFLEDDEAFVQEGGTSELYENLKKRKSPAMVIPHLHYQTNWERHDPELERVVEVYSHWGCGLSLESDPPIIPGMSRAEESYVHHALAHGAKLGFIASADHSYGHPGDDFWWSLSDHNGGLAAVYADELSRRGLWDALWTRRCYATTRARIILEFFVSGHPMGEEIDDEDTARDLTVNVHGVTGVQTVEIIKNGRLWKRFPADGQLDVELSCQDDLAENETDYYYAHVRQIDGEQAWSSPIWISSPLDV